MTGITLAKNLYPKVFKILILDKGKKIGGRMASKSIYLDKRKFTYDYGAQFFTVRSEEFQNEVSKWEKKNFVKVWCNGFNKIDGHKRYISIKGMQNLFVRLSNNLNILQNQRVTVIKYANNLWEVKTNKDIFKSELLIITTPLPQCLDLLKTNLSLFDNDTIDEIKNIDYKKCITLIMVLNLKSNFNYPGAYQRIDCDWDFICDNNLKGISPNVCVTAHASNILSKKIWDFSESRIKDYLLEKIKIRFNLYPEYSLVHKWLYAQSQKNLDGYFRSSNSTKNHLFIAGEIFGGSKIEGAFLSGYNLARHINAS